MMVAFRIVESKDCGDTVRLKLTTDGIEDPTAAAVLLDTDTDKLRDWPFEPGAVAEFNGSLRPTVLVNGVWMYLQQLKVEPIFDLTAGFTAAAGVQTVWTIGPKSRPKSMKIPSINNPRLARQIGKTMMAQMAMVAKTETIMVVAWE